MKLTYKYSYTFAQKVWAKYESDAGFPACIETEIFFDFRRG